MKRVLPVIASGIVLAIIAGLGVWTRQPWLDPRLDLAGLTQTSTPQAPKAWSIGVGQLLGPVGGFIGVFVTSATTSPLFAAEHVLVLPRVWAVLIEIVRPPDCGFFSRQRTWPVVLLPCWLR